MTDDSPCWTLWIRACSSGIHSAFSLRASRIMWFWEEPITSDCRSWPSSRRIWASFWATCNPYIHKHTWNTAIHTSGVSKMFWFYIFEWSLSCLSMKMYENICAVFVETMIQLFRILWWIERSVCSVQYLKYKYFCNIMPSLSLWLHRYYLNWTELDDDITEFNNEMPLTEKWAFKLVILHYYIHYYPILILCSCFDTICIFKSTI